MRDSSGGSSSSSDVVSISSHIWCGAYRVRRASTINTINSGNCMTLCDMSRRSSSITAKRSVGNQTDSAIWVTIRCVAAWAVRRVCVMMIFCVLSTILIALCIESIVIRVSVPLPLNQCSCDFFLQNAKYQMIQLCRSTTNERRQ